jgi:type I restriction enzyme S subunit
MERKLPKGWLKKPFTEILDIQGGTQPPKEVFISEERDRYIRLLQIRDFGEKPVPTYIPNETNLKTCSVDDILIARYGASIGRIVTGHAGAYNVALAKVIIPELINRRFIFWLLKSPLFQINITSFQRTAQNGFNKEDLSGLEIPLPPLPEQQRIVAKLDTLFGHLDALKTRLDRIPQLLKDFRQKVLTQAVTGKLTEEWREGKELEEWKTEALGNVLKDVKYGTSKKSEYETIGTPILRIPNIKNGEIDISDLKFSILDDKEYVSLKLNEGDILIIRSNGSVSLVGQSAIIRKDLEGYSYAGYLIRLRVKKALFPDYLNYALESHSLREQIVETSRSTSGVNNINTQEIKDLIISYPPIEEQQEIVRRVESLFAKADQIEASYLKLKAKIEQLPQALLAKAFRGELVEQLPTDGDALDLLEKIKRAKEGLEKGGKGRKLKVEDEVRMVADEGARYGKK